MLLQHFRLLQSTHTKCLRLVLATVRNDCLFPMGFTGLSWEQGHFLRLEITSFVIHLKVASLGQRVSKRCHSWAISFQVTGGSSGEENPRPKCLQAQPSCSRLLEQSIQDNTVLWHYCRATHCLCTIHLIPCHQMLFWKSQGERMWDFVHIICIRPRCIPLLLLQT